MARRDDVDIHIRAHDRSAQGFARVRQNLADLDRRTVGLDRSMMRLAGTLAAAVTVERLSRAVGQAISDVADLGNAANRAGVSAEGLQVYRRALEQNGATARDADEAMRRLTRRMGEFANSGGGPAKAAIEGLGLEVHNLDGSLRTTEDIMVQVAQRFGQIENPAIAAAYAAQIFGDDAGPRLVPLLMQGEQAIRDYRDELIDANALISNDTAQRAIEIQDAYSELTGNLSLMFQNLTVQSADMALDVASRWINSARTAAEEVADLIDLVSESSLGSGTPTEQLSRRLGLYDRQSRRRGGASLLSENYFDRSSFRMPPQDGGSAIVIDPLEPPPANDLRVLRQERDLRSEIIELQGTQGLAQDRLNDTTQFFGQSVLSGLSSVVFHGQEAEDVILRLAMAFGEAALQAALLGEGPLAGLFGGQSGGLLGAFTNGLSGGTTNAFGPGTSIPIYHSGTPYVPQTGFAYLEEGEAVVSKQENRRGGTGGRLRIDLGPDLEARFMDQTARQSVEIFRQGSPGIVDQSVASTSGAIQSGGMDASMGKRFNLAPSARPR